MLNWMEHNLNNASIDLFSIPMCILLSNEWDSRFIYYTYVPFQGISKLPLKAQINFIDCLAMLINNSYCVELYLEHHAIAYRKTKTALYVCSFVFVLKLFQDLLYYS